MKLLVILFLLTNSLSLLLETGKLKEISRITGQIIRIKDNTGHFCQKQDAWEACDHLRISNRNSNNSLGIRAWFPGYSNNGARTRLDFNNNKKYWEGLLKREEKNSVLRRHTISFNSININ